MGIAFEQRNIGLIINGKGGSRQGLKQLFNSDGFNRIGFSALGFRLLNFLLFHRMNMRGKVVRLRIPKPVDEIIKSTDTGGGAKMETAKNGIGGVSLIELPSR